jgi:hypothetical protein
MAGMVHRGVNYWLIDIPTGQGITKHVEIDFHFVRDMVAKKLIFINFISTKDQLANIFTKPLLSSWFSTLRDKLNVISIPFGLKGHIRDIQLIN